MNIHGTEVRQSVLTLLRDGAQNADLARQFNIPIGTIGYWKHRDRAERGECPGRRPSPCPRCDGVLNSPAYAYLLGLYLGDGHIIQNRAMRSPSLSITCDESHPGLMDACEDAMRSVLPGNSVCRVRRKGCRELKVYSMHLWCLFPQHGPGKKHERTIALEAWQQAIVDAHPWSSSAASSIPTAAASRTGRPAWSAVSAGATNTRVTSSPTYPTTSAASIRTPSTSSASSGRTAHGKATRTTSPSPAKPP